MDTSKFLTTKEVKARLAAFNDPKSPAYYDYEILGKDVPNGQEYAFLYPHIHKVHNILPEMPPNSIDYTKVSNNPEVIKLIKEREKLFLIKQN